MNSELDARDSSDEFPWHLGVFDAHCHPTDDMRSTSLITKMKTRGLTVMATRGQDQELVSQLASLFSISSVADLGKSRTDCRVVPCFGWHPWFSHMMYDDTEGSVDPEVENFKLSHYQSILVPKPEDDKFIDSLPTPRSLRYFIQEIRSYLETYPVALIGEIGLDKSFRLPAQASCESQHEGITPGGREGRRLTRYQVQIYHQRAILKAQLHLAGEMNRPVSIHSVQAHGLVFDILHETWKNFEKKSTKRVKAKLRKDICRDISETHTTSEEDIMLRSYPPKICLHSYSGSSELLKQYLHPSVPVKIYFSFSCLINSLSPKVIEVIKAIPENRILVESDFHRAGDEMDELLEKISRLICEVKGWPLVEGIIKLGENWQNFIFS
ncbi:TatD DNase family Scn1/Cut9 interacting protein Scn1 [Blumeria hordei DH14]|uniref:TatD DNase family Scn1/Cut9 interacting protein Scn1 n=1 Tax=Blumeria graminis f. sp. hordei (strain DH14) TaxID=546991 RepID=N1J5R6_BLUG1|nr:TatD DNase family Scn1/Cut9 interacting protein Scn1 [Blumeria hordei DH14]